MDDEYTPLAERLIIGETDKCSICGKDFKYRFPRWRFSDTPDGLLEVIMRTEHPACLSLVRRMEMLKREITDLEFELFRKRI
jgi:hypothetical protein